MIATLLALPRPTADDYYNSYNSSSDLSPAAVFGMIVGVLAIYLLVFIVMYAIVGLSMMGIFQKAGHAKWKAFVPFYSNWMMVKIAGRPESHFWLQFIPYAGLYWTICTYNDVAKSFGKDSAYTVGMVFLPVIFFAILSYGEAQYRGPAYMSPEQKFYADQYGQQYGTPAQYGAPAQYQGQYGQQAQAPGYDAYGQPLAPQAPPQQPYGQPVDPNAPTQDPYGSGPTK